MDGNTSLPRLIISAGTAGGFAEVVSIPIETAKVRLQMQGNTYKGVVHAMRTIAKEEGVLQLWKGVTAGVQRHFGCAGFRLGMYAPIRDFWTPKGHEGPASFKTKCLAAFTSGGISMFLISPADVVKTRIQADTNKGGAPRYPSPTRAYGMIVTQEGVSALWTGIGPNALRNATMNIFEVGCYDQAKQMLMSQGFPEGVPLHISSGLIAAFTACAAACPLDVVKNRWISNPGNRFTSVTDVVSQTFKHEGPMAFYTGFTPFFMRASVFICAQFVAYEQVLSIVKSI
eukprot:TRINITY_DN809_c5_g1_i1.p1 TRINITY_DN809_c5_g1~~TRINITY_DN809_c5_g1_i1.p1  ORF type:complete len:305 (+),score=54.99 TRINITY_DN809_c5_g1_i1:60-917(+)